MDKETAERLTRLETKMDDVQKDHESWNLLVKKVVSQSIIWLLSMGGMGVLLGWHLPEPIRKAIVDWASK